MTVATTADQHLCNEVRALGEATTPGEVRRLREYGVLDVIGSRSGGRGKAASYGPGSAEVVAAVVAARRDPGYAHKFARSLLIAWARGALMADEGLRQALREHYRAEENRAIRETRGTKVRDEEPDLHVSPGLYRELAEAAGGQKLGSEQIARLGTRVEITQPAGSDHVPVAPSSVLVLVEERPDGTHRTTAVGERVMDALALQPLVSIARKAPRAELDIARNLVRPMWGRVGLDPSDLVVADSACRFAQLFRSSVGPQWWTRTTI